MPPQLVLEIKRFKISKDVWSTSKSRRIVAFAEGSYHSKIVKSVDSKVYAGTKLCLPWNETLQRLQVNFYFIDDLLTIDIGTALYALSEDGKFMQETASTEVMLKIYPVGATVPIGRALVSITVQDMFDDENTGVHKCSVPKQSVIDHDFAVPGFRFKRLSRVPHWERIRSLNISQTVQNGDVRTLLTCLDDVTSADVSQEDIDPQLYKALQLAQYGSQYLLSCRKVMKDREAVLKTALKTFQQEEDLIDLKLAKLRARDKSLQREARDLDDLTVEYSAALKEVNPRLINTLYKTYQEKVRIPSTGQLVQMADERKLDYEDRYDGYSSEERHRSRHRGANGERGDRRRHPEYHRPSSNLGWEEAPPVSEQMNLQPREPHVFDLQTAMGPRRTLRTSTGSSRHIGDPWASADSRDPPRKNFRHPDRQDPAHREREELDAENSHPSNAPAPLGQWKSTAVASTREIPTGHTRPSVAIDRSRQDGWAEVQAAKAGSDSGSDDGSGGIRRVVSRSEFAAVPVQPILRTLSVRSINVNADAVTAHKQNEPVSNSTRGPLASASVEVPRDGWSGAPLHSNVLHPNPDRNFSTARLAPVQQSTSEMSQATTAMSVDSLNPRMTPQQQPHSSERSGPGHADRSRYSEEDKQEEDDVSQVVAELSRNNESYENIDMSTFINANNASRISRASDRDDTITSVERYIADDMRDLEVERLHANTNSNLNTLNSTGGDSFMVEEFDDSLHMDHRPISGFNSSEPQPEPRAEQLRVSTGASTPGRAPLLPPSASKSTPLRPERGGSSPGDYSMSHDSPFPDLSGGKDYNRLMSGGHRANHSHISSNASTSRNYNNHTGASDSYDQDTFEDEDDPFGRGGGGSGPQRTLDLTNVTGGSTDIDASKSITIDFVLPSESKDLQRHAATRSSDAGAKSQYGVGRSSRYEEPDSFSGELDLFSPLGGPRSMPFGGMRGPGSRGMGDDDDDVLMGTTKLSSTGRGGDFSNTFQSRGTAGSEKFEQDSLGGTFNSNPSSNPTRSKVASFSPMAEIAGGAEGEEEEEEESIPPPTYDSMIGTGNTEDSLRASNSQLQHDEVSSFFEVSADAPTHPHLLDMHNIQTEAEAAGITAPGWQVGRAPVDAIELATAFDVFVSAVRLDAQHARIYSEIQIKLEFLGIMSHVSSVVDLSRTQSVQPVSFSAHLQFSPEQEELLQEEIAELDDAIACHVHVIDAVTQEIVGTASVQLWVMVEDSVNILRQEVEVLNLDLSSEMGSALVDVKGFRLLKKCANAQRQRRSGH